MLYTSFVCCCPAVSIILFLALALSCCQSVDNDYTHSVLSHSIEIPLLAKAGIMGTQIQTLPESWELNELSYTAGERERERLLT